MDVMTTKEAADESSKLIDNFKTARKLLKQPVDYTNLNEVHSRCKIIMEKLGNTLKVLENTDKNLKNNGEGSTSKQSISAEKNYEKKSGTKKRSRCKRNPSRKEANLEKNVHEEKKVTRPVSIMGRDSKVKKKKRTFRPFDLKTNQVSRIDFWSKSDIVKHMIPKDVIEYSEEPNSFSCEALASCFSPLTATNTWELTQLKRMIEDPFLSSTRKEQLYNRILELNNTIIQDLLKQAESSDHSEFFVLDKLYKMSTDASIPSEQQQQVQCIFTALREKMITGLMKDVADDETDYNKTIEKLQALLRFPFIPQADKEKFLEKVMEIRAKMASGLSKQTHVPIEDGVRLLERIRQTMKDPLLPQETKSKMLDKVKYLRNTTLAKLTRSSILENNEELVNNLNSMLQDPLLSYKKRLEVVNKIKSIEEKASKALKANKQELKDQLMTCMDEILGFQGTNLDFMTGYGVDNPQYIRCIYIWNPKPL